VGKGARDPILATAKLLKVRAQDGLGVGLSLHGGRNGGGCSRRSRQRGGSGVVTAAVGLVASDGNGICTAGVVVIGGA